MFTVIDTKTGKEADTYKIALKEEWAKHLCYCDMEGFAIEEDGTLVLLDECGKVAYCPEGRFKIVQEPQWIPVTERLPEKPENYPHCELRQCYFLVTLESTAVVSCGYDFENKRWREFFKVTHWMPLPAPPAVDTDKQP